MVRSTDVILFGGVLVLVGIWVSVSGLGRESTSAVFAVIGLLVAILGAATSVFPQSPTDDG